MDDRTRKRGDVEVQQERVEKKKKKTCVVTIWVKDDALYREKGVTIRREFIEIRGFKDCETLIGCFCGVSGLREEQDRKVNEEFGMACAREEY